MWNSPLIQHQGDDYSSWEVRAFEEDTGTFLPSWPPRSYPCSFCRREFKSAQALGGHMNVHRRDRARAALLNQTHIQSAASSNPPHGSSSSSPFNIPEQEFLSAHGLDLCLLYQPPGPNSGIITGPSSLNICNFEPPSTVLNDSNYIQLIDNVSSEQGVDSGCLISSSSNKAEWNKEPSIRVEEVDLELRLGHG